MMSDIALPYSDLYLPIQSHLDQVIEIMDRELRSDLPFVDDLSAHAQRYRGKMLRPAVVLLVGEAMDGSQEAHRVIAAVVEMVHLATLVHDDVLDDADIRRKHPTINQLRGNETAVMLGDYLISHAFHLCARLDSQHATRRIGATTNTVCEGELMQLHHRGNVKLTQRQYMDMIRRKTASLTAVCGELGAHFAGADSDLTDAMGAFGESAGVAFQIMDDVLDLVGSESRMGKTLGRDMDLAKLTLPVIHCLAHADKSVADRLASILQGTIQDDRSEIARLLNQSQSIDYAIQVAQQHTQEAINSLQRLPDSPARASLLAMTEFIINRNH